MEDAVNMWHYTISELNARYDDDTMTLCVHVVLIFNGGMLCLMSDRHFQFGTLVDCGKY